MPATSIGFWRVLIGTVALVIWGVLFRRDLFRADRRAWLLVGLGGGAMVALFEIAYQFAIGGVGVAGAAALLYTAPGIVPVLARVILKEALTPTRIALAILVMIGVALTVTGGSNAGAEAARMGVTVGVAGGLLSALSYALTSLMGRYAAPRYGVTKVLFLEAVGGVVLIWIALAIWGRPPALPPSPAAWRGLLGLAAGSGVPANFLFFWAIKGIQAGPASVARDIVPSLRALLPLLVIRH